MVVEKLSYPRAGNFFEPVGNRIVTTFNL